MGSNCCKDRRKQSNLQHAPLLKTAKTRRRTSVRVDLVRQQEPLKRSSECPPPTTFSSVFSKLIKSAAAPSPTRDPGAASETETDLASAYLRAETLHLDQSPTRVTSLSAASQIQIQRLMGENHESALAVYALSFNYVNCPAVTGSAVMSDKHLYLFSENEAFASPAETLNLSSILVILLHAKSAILVFSSTSLDPALMELRSSQLLDLLKNIQLLSYQSIHSFLPISVFDNFQHMQSYSKSLGNTDISALKSPISLKIQELIMTTGSDLFESRVLVQECWCRGKEGWLVITNRKVYAVDGEWGLKEMRRLEEIEKVNYVDNQLYIHTKSSTLELTTSDCSKVIELAMKSVK